MKKNLLLLPLVVFLAACATTLPTVPGALPEGDIAAIVTAANEGEIQQGQAASERATSAEVRAFAQMMVADHTAALDRGREVFGRFNVTPSDSDVSRTLRDNSGRTVTALNTYTGSAFDREYMRTQIDLHQWLLNSLDQSLIPSATRRDVREMLEAQRASVAAHLDRARAIQAGLR